MIKIDANMEYLEINSRIMFGKPIIKGTRKSVNQITSLLTNGISMEMITPAFKEIKRELAHKCLQFVDTILEKNSIFELNKIVF